MQRAVGSVSETGYKFPHTAAVQYLYELHTGDLYYKRPSKAMYNRSKNAQISTEFYH